MCPFTLLSSFFIHTVSKVFVIKLRLQNSESVIYCVNSGENSEILSDVRCNWSFCYPGYVQRSLMITSTSTTRIQYGHLGKSFWWIFLRECVYEQKSRFSLRKPSQKTHLWRKGPCIKFPACFWMFFSAVLTDTACSVYPLGLVFWMC